jgi:DNA-binding response OmpR family regulator
MSARVLIVDDEPRYVRLMEANLSTEGYQVLKATNGQEAVQAVVDQKPDLVILDIMMPIMDGFAACERIREFSNVPIIMVTAKGEERDRVRGLDLGADDYIVKPFSATEILARVRAVLRRAQKSGLVAQQSVFTHGELRIDLARAEVFRDHRMVFLSATEYRLLLQFVQNVGKVLSAEQLLKDVWGTEYSDDKEI